MPSIPAVRFSGADRAAWPYGASVKAGAARFRLWAPDAAKVELVRIRLRKNLKESLEERIMDIRPMQKRDGDYTASMPASDKLLYMFRLTYPDGRKSRLLPDPRSRYQPEDVHGPSQVIPKDNYRWRIEKFDAPTDRRKLNIYEMHVGTFSKQGTFESAIAKLDEIKNAGFNTVEVMPVKEFPGKRNWGYDMVGFFAVENAYGKPEDFKRFVDEAHKRGLAVVLDVVYNHIGPEGNYFRQFDRNLVSDHVTPWGDQFNFGHPQIERFIKDNLSLWLREYRVDGFRFDMTNHVPDDVLRMMNRHVQNVAPDAILIAEDGRSENHITLPLAHGGLGYWGKWNFDYHHLAKSNALGTPHMDNATDTASFANVLGHGFKPHNPPMNNLFDAVDYLESHDEIGNHDGNRAIVKAGAGGERRAKLHSILKLLVPGIPMTFMGEEYGERNPFYFFTDHSDPVLNRNMRKDRKDIPQPDCTRAKTFTASKLSWRKEAGFAELYAAANRLRAETPALWQGGRQEMDIHRQYLASNVLAIHRRGRENPESEVFIVANLSDYDYPAGQYAVQFPPGRWEEVLNTDDRRFGGGGGTNAARPLRNKAGIALPGWQISIFRKDR